MMSTRDIFERDYYILIRKQDELDFVNLLNQNSELVQATKPPISTIVDELFSVLQTDSSSPGMTKLPIGTEAVDRQLRLTLQDHPLVSGVNNEVITNALFTNALSNCCLRLFAKNEGNSEGFLIQEYVHAWIEDILTKAICADSRFSDFTIIMKLINQAEMLHFLYTSLLERLPGEWIVSQSKLWTEPGERIDDLLKHTAAYDREYLDGYRYRLNKLQNLTPWRYIVESTRYSDQLMFSRELAFRSSVLLERELADWLRLWDNLELPVLQDVPFHFINYPPDFVDLSAALSKTKDQLKSNPEHLACILLKSVFESSNVLSRRLGFYNDDERIKSLSQLESRNDILASGKRALDQWQAEKKKTYQEVIKLLSLIVSHKTIEEWIFSYSPRRSPQNQFTDQHNLEIEALVEAYGQIVETLPFDVVIKDAKENFSLQRFNFIVHHYGEKLTEKQIGDCLDLFIEFTKSDGFYWDHSFGPPFWESLKAVGFLLSKTSEPIKSAGELLVNARVHHEGWNINRNNYKLVTRESFLLCGVSLLFEHDNAFQNDSEREGFFRILLHQVIEQVRFAVSDVNESYRCSLQLLYLIVNQTNAELKEYFESEIARNIDNLSLTLAVLSTGDHHIGTSTKDLIRSRLAIELGIEQKKNKRARNSDFIENCLKKLGIDD
jgi:hypothetical protein